MVVTELCRLAVKRVCSNGRGDIDVGSCRIDMGGGGGEQ